MTFHLGADFLDTAIFTKFVVEDFQFRENSSQI